MYISLKDLGFAIVCITVMGVGVYLVYTLKNINSVVIQFKKLLETNSEHINKSLAALPDTVKNANELSVSARNQIDGIGTAVNSVGSALSETAAALNEKTVTGVSVIKTIIETAVILKDLFINGREKEN